MKFFAVSPFDRSDAFCRPEAKAHGNFCCVIALKEQLLENLPKARIELMALLLKMREHIFDLQFLVRIMGISGSIQKRYMLSVSLWNLAIPKGFDAAVVEDLEKVGLQLALASKLAFPKLKEDICQAVEIDIISSGI